MCIARLGYSAIALASQNLGRIGGVPAQAPFAMTRLKDDRKLAVCVIWKAAQAVDIAWVSRDARTWGIDSLRRATIDIPRTQNWNAMNTMSSRLVLRMLQVD